MARFFRNTPVISSRKSRSTALILAALIFAGVGSTATAQETDTTAAPGSAVDSQWSFGLQAAPLIFGLSVRYQVDVWQFQGIIQPAGEELSGAFRVLRTATQKQYWRSYLFAGVARSEEDSFTNYEETAVTGGLGVEWSWAAKNPSLPPLSWSLELGLGYGSRVLDFDLLEDETDDEFFLALGASIHYHFE